MIVVPRTYGRTPPTQRTSDYGEKTRRDSTNVRSKSPRLPDPAKSSPLNPTTINFAKQEIKSQGLRLPGSRWIQAKEQPQRPSPQPVQQPEVKTVPAATKSEPIRLDRESAQSLLSATSIPIRRRPKGRPSQRIPRGNHVADFSRLLLDDIKPTKSGGSLPRSYSNSNFEGLFGNMDELLEEGQMYVGSEGADTGMLSTRSVSEESMPSLASPDDFIVSDAASQDSSMALSLSERRLRSLATSEDVSQDHPLKTPMLENDDFDFSFEDTPTSSPPSMAKQKHVKKSRGLKSSLTASFRALKQAAPTSILTRNFFDIQPSLTDDRRPPPSVGEPTAELRRYLNPTPLEHAAQFHTWQDHRHVNLDPPTPPPQERSNPRKRNTSRTREKKPVPATPKPIPGNRFSKIQNLPPVVPLASCIPGTIKTPNASSPPIWLSDDGTPINDRTAVPLLYDPNSIDGRGRPAITTNNSTQLQRHREPRENRDFLRVFVVEMQMRHAGKLDDDLSKGRAKLWLPAVRESNVAGHRKRSAEQRLSLMNAAEEEEEEEEGTEEAVRTK